jgi:sugar phosphate isomerase/epimerase
MLRLTPATLRRADWTFMEAYDKLAGQLCHVYLSYSDLSCGEQHRILGKGRLPLKEFLAALERDGCPGAVSLELKPCPLATPNPEVILKRMREALRFVCEGLVG